MSAKDSEAVVVRLKGVKGAKKHAAKVKVFATFVFVKTGNNPSVYIENPVNLSEHIGDVYATDYIFLKERLASIVDINW